MRRFRPFTALLTLLVLSACAKASVVEAPVAPPRPSDLSAKMTFKSYLSLGFPEQDVYVEQVQGSHTVERFAVRQLANPSNMTKTFERTVFTSKTAQAHDPYKKTPGWQGPYEKGVSLHIALQKWTSGQGVGRYTVKDGTATVLIDFWKLVKGGTYSLWCSQISEQGLIEKPCVEPGKPGNPIVMDARGEARLETSFPALPDTTTMTGSWLSLALHSDGHQHAVENDFGKNTHVQLLWKVPTLAEMRPAY